MPVLILLLLLIIILILAILLKSRFIGFITGGNDLTEDERNIALEIITANKNRDNSKTKPMLQHCLCQLIRISRDEANRELPEKLAQFGLNLGRAQEILNSVGGVNYWWRRYEPLIKNKDWNEIENQTRLIIKELDLPDVNDLIIASKCEY